jgi:hypothetical protein
MLACILERCKRNFNGRPFFSLFFVASANQDFCDLALGRHSIRRYIERRYLSIFLYRAIDRQNIEFVRASIVGLDYWQSIRIHQRDHGNWRRGMRKNICGLYPLTILRLKPMLRHSFVPETHKRRVDVTMFTAARTPEARKGLRQLSTSRNPPFVSGG